MPKHVLFLSQESPVERYLYDLIFSIFVLSNRFLKIWAEGPFVINIIFNFQIIRCKCMYNLKRK